VDFIDVPFAQFFAPALTKVRENRDVIAKDILEVDFGICVVLLTDGDSGTGDVFKAEALGPKFIRVSRLNVDGFRDIAERIVNEGESSLVLFDCGIPLTVKAGIDERKLPSG